MTMTPTEVNAALLDFANNRCNQEWTAEDAPARVNLFIERAAAYLTGSTGGVQSKRLGDMSISYSTEFPKDILDLLGRPKVSFV